MPMPLSPQALLRLLRFGFWLAVAVAFTAAVVPFLVLTFSLPRPGGPRATAELVAAALLTLSAGYIAINETIANWQSLWFCAALIGLVVTLLRARDAPG